jgi:Family of unknown function (DUF6401)
MFAEGFARTPLRWVMDVFGIRLSDLSADPALVAMVDQHAAAIRDGISLSQETLSDYLLGFIDGLREWGWSEPTDYDFPMLRLTAVCWLIREHGFLPAV